MNHLIQLYTFQKPHIISKPVQSQTTVQFVKNNFNINKGEKKNPYSFFLSTHTITQTRGWTPKTTLLNLINGHK